MEKVLVFGLLVAVSLSTVNGLSCIVCDSAEDKECGDPFTANQDKYLVKCQPEEKFCKKTVEFTDPRSPAFYKRSCALDLSNKNYTWNPEGCKELNQLTVCYCNAMRCNGAGRSGLCFVLITISLIFAYLIKRNY